MIPDQHPNYYKALEIYTGYFDRLDFMIPFSYPSSIVITRLLYKQNSGQIPRNKIKP